MENKSFLNCLTLVFVITAFIWQYSEAICCPWKLSPVITEQFNFLEKSDPTNYIENVFKCYHSLEWIFYLLIDFFFFFSYFYPISSFHLFSSPSSWARPLQGCSSSVVVGIMFCDVTACRALFFQVFVVN